MNHCNGKQNHLSRPCHRFPVFPHVTAVQCFLLLSTGSISLATTPVVSFLPMLGTGCTFSHASHRLHVFRRLKLVARFALLLMIRCYYYGFGSLTFVFIPVTFRHPRHPCSDSRESHYWSTIFHWAIKTDVRFACLNTVKGNANKDTILQSFCASSEDSRVAVDITTAA